MAKPKDVILDANPDSSNDPDVTPIKERTALQRFYSGNEQMDHDLFKLEVSKMIKDHGWGGNQELVGHEHCHMFHTIDSDGRPQTLCTSTGGHFHIMRIVKNKAGEILDVICDSGPMEMVRKKIKNKWVKVAQPLNEDLEDNHRHDVRYIRSDRINKRQINAEATVVIAMDAQKTAPIAGVGISGSLKSRA